VITCPSCFGRAFLGSKFCSFCSAALDAPAAPIRGDAAHALRRCPRCPERPPSPLVAHVSGDVVLDECGRCGGMYVERRTFDRLVTDREKQSAIFAALDPAQAAAAPQPMTAQNATVAYLRCPDCGGLMNRTNFGKRSGVIIDVCAPHGIWFDRDELRRVLEFVRQGGLDETRRREVEELKKAALNQKMAAAAHAMSTHDRDAMSHESGLVGVGVELVIDALLKLW
jgi:Zn-finger nucleic acid-binding protein